MSGTTEQPAAVPALALLPGQSQVARPTPAVAAADLVRLAQGLYFIFWGLLAVVLVASLMLLAAWLPSVVEVFLAGGILAVLAGSWRLSQTRLGGPATAADSTTPVGQASCLSVEAERRDRQDACPTLAAAAWRRETQRLLGVAGLLAYFCLLFCLWRRRPLNLYLQVNAVAFVGSGVLYILILSRTVAALAVRLGRPELAGESRLFGIGNLVLLLGPFAGALLWLGLRATRHQRNLWLEFHSLLLGLNLLILTVLLLPFALTLALAWSAKDAVLRQLAALGTES